MLVLKIALGVVAILTILVVLGCCVISSECSRMEEEEYEDEFYY